jgi:CubicO group peptidase (beta-lactamase class C family)
MKAFRVQGCAVAVLDDNQVIHCQGYGFRDITNNAPVNTATLFGIGSATKAFTSAAMAMLVDRGKLDWDKPMREYIPWFKLYDPVASEHMTPRDLVCHRSGLPRHDLLWYGTSRARKDLMERLHYLEPNKDFRELMQYQNLMFMAAGYLIEIVSGSSWEDFVRREIFKPLGMKRSNVSVEESKGDANASKPYANEKNKPKEIPYRNIDTIGPAGSINSTIDDLIPWLFLHLNEGKHNGKELVSKANLDETHRPNMVITGEFMGEIEKYPEYGSGAYGLGWFNSSYQGHKLIHHGGNIDGFSTMVSFMPREKLGVIVLTNQNGSSLPVAATFGAYDRLLKLERAPWIERSRQIEKAQKKAIQKSGKKTQENKARGTRPSHPLDGYLGQYEHPGYGILTVSEDENGLKADFNELSFRMTHYHYDIFEIKYDLFDMPLKLNFATDVQGNICGLSAQLEPSVNDIVFTHMPDKKLSKTNYLKQFLGDYELLDRTLVISLRDNTLVAAMPGQAELVLQPYREMKFKAKNAPGILMEFHLDEDKILRVDIIQPGAVFTAKKIV